MELKLSDDQVAALEKMKQFVKNKEPILVLQGYAGTGKTYLLREFIKYLNKSYKDYILCAPTHKAKLVLGEVTQCENTITLHSLLALAPNVEIFELDYKDLKFKSTGLAHFPEDSIIIIDEASMITDELYKLLTELGNKNKDQILFIGDKAQLAPINSKGTSLVFNNDNKITLTKIFRQKEDNKLGDLLFSLRTRPINRFPSNNESLIIYRDTKQFLTDCAEDFSKAIKTQNVNYLKLIAYTNKRVQGLNVCMRKLLGFKEDYQQYEFLTGYENFEYNKSQFYNSLDYIILNKPKKVERKIPNFIKLPGYELELFDTVYKEVYEVFMLDKNINPDYINSLSSTIENIRLNALESQIQGNRTRALSLWKQYYSMIKSFASPMDLMWDNRVIKKKTFDYGYAMTVHKIQGVSLNTVFVDMNNISTCRDDQTIRQMQYVSLSRTKTNAHILV